MTARAFDTLIGDDGQTLVGPWRAPQQMLAAQVYDGHVSIHDDAMAKKMGFKAATIEGPTHFSQFAPLCAQLWGEAWFETGCISAHYRSAVFAGEEVQASAAKPNDGESQVDHPHGEARRHRGLARDRFGRTAGGADRPRSAAAR